MFQITKKADYDLPDAADFVNKINALPSDFFYRENEIFVARAPGRLDVMGGIADYSGSLVLEMPIAEATFAALQKRTDKSLKIFSEVENDKLFFEMPLDDFEQNGNPIEYAAARQYFNRNPENHWAAYIAGVFHVLMREKNLRFETGANIYIASTIPQGKGVSSSAALEASVMSAVAAAFNIALNPRETAILCQKVENLIVGAPCGIMDQMSVICGKKEELTAMLCQPAELRTPIKIPAEICFWGIDSGIRHAVVGADYGSVRTGAFIGYRMIAALENLPFKNDKITDEKWRGFAANITPEEFEAKYKNKIPLTISGAEFLEKYSGITDTVTSVAPEKTYAVFYPTKHPIYENARVHEFAKLLGAEMSKTNLHALGELMFASHESYSACGLGADGTDLLVKLIKEIGAGSGLYGAKITGGGSGGTVAVLGLKNAFPAIEKVAAEYAQQTNHQPYIFSGSSPGAADFGCLKLKPL